MCSEAEALLLPPPAREDHAAHRLIGLEESAALQNCQPSEWSLALPPNRRPEPSTSSLASEPASPSTPRPGADDPAHQAD
eukprot:2069309-Alexandrium_andersonii.AAC.1